MSYIPLDIRIKDVEIQTKKLTATHIRLTFDSHAQVHEVEIPSSGVRLYQFSAPMLYDYDNQRLVPVEQVPDISMKAKRSSDDRELFVKIHTEDGKPIREIVIDDIFTEVFLTMAADNDRLWFVAPSRPKREEISLDD